MLEYKKQILVKVSHYPEIFRRELEKAMKRLDKHELELLKDWCFETFSDHHLHIVTDIVTKDAEFKNDIVL